MDIFIKILKIIERDKKWDFKTDQEIKQRKNFELNKRYNVDMFSTAVRGGKAFAVEQKLRELKKSISKLKATEKNPSKKINMYQIITKFVENMNSLPTAKYKHIPNDIENKILNSEVDRERFNFTRLLRIGKEKAQHEDTMEKFTWEKTKVKIVTRPGRGSSHFSWMIKEKKIHLGYFIKAAQITNRSLTDKRNF